MDLLLGKITQQAMNYAIRSGITITSTYAIRQCSRLLKSVEGNDREELIALQNKLDSKIRIISPAIDMIELISARGNTSLESAVTLTKALRWDIQALGVRLAEAAAAEEASRGNSKPKVRVENELKLKQIILDIRKLLERIEDSVPFINLAITTSGASLTTTLPASVSPSRLLQASTFLTAGDTQYSMEPGRPVHVGTTFILSVYMLFSGHTFRLQDEEGSIREKTWKEVIHKGRVKLRRVPLEMVDNPSTSEQQSGQRYAGNGDWQAFAPGRTGPHRSSQMSGEAKADEFAYELQMIEDLDDDRYHSFNENEPQPSPYEDVELAGIRESIPIHQISKLFYADTGKILNIGAEGEPNSPVLLLKRDVNAVAPRKMVEKTWLQDGIWGGPDDEEVEENHDATSDTQDEVNAQLDQEQSRSASACSEELTPTPDAWRLPQDLDPEWIAFEVWQEPEGESDYEDEPSPESGVPSSTSGITRHKDSVDPKIASAMSNLSLSQQAPTNSPHAPSPPLQKQQLTSYQTQIPPQSLFPISFTGGPVRSSLSLLEMLIRLTALQQFQQCSHLSIHDELLSFFLEESSTTGAGGDGEERRRKRMDARRKVGFDPYDESPIKRRGEQYYQQHQDSDFQYDENDIPTSPSHMSARSPSVRASPALVTPQRGLIRHESIESKLSQKRPVSPRDGRRFSTPSAAKTRQGALRRDPTITTKGSPLGRGVSVETDSTLGTSPAEPDKINDYREV